MSVLRATFQPEAWVNDYAVPVDPEGDTSWAPTIGAATLGYLSEVGRRRGESLDDPIWGVLDNDDVLKDDPAAPEWIREWRGPFTIRVFRTAS